MRLNSIIILSIFLISINFISAVPPVTTTQQFTEGYYIQIPQDNILKQGQNYTFDFHVHNISNGVIIQSGISCDFQLYDDFGNHQYILINSTPDIHGDYSFYISGGNFTKVTSYYYLISCNSSTLGGFGESIIYITENGENPDSVRGITLLGSFFIVILFFALGVIFPKEKWKIKTFFFLCSLLMGLIFFNTIKLVTGTSNEVSLMNELGLILLIAVVSFMFLYTMINYTIEVFNYFKEKKEMKWKISGGE